MRHTRSKIFTEVTSEVLETQQEKCKRWMKENLK